MEALEAELQDISSQESKDEASLAKVKKQLRDLEAKVKDQEEELDEQAGTIQMLEQVRRGGARFLGGVVSCRAVITWAGLAWEEEAARHCRSRHGSGPSVPWPGRSPWGGQPSWPQTWGFSG